MTDITVLHQEGKTFLTNHQGSSLDISLWDPSDLLAGALGKCTEGTVRNFARKNGYNLSSFSVRVEFERDRETKTSTFVVNLDLNGDLTESQIRKLRKVAEKSFISRVLSQPINLESRFEH